MFLSVVSILLLFSPALGEDYGDYIVAGTEVYPKYRLGYQALFKRCPNGKGCGVCGGTVIHPRYVITAAHCLYNRNDKNKTRMTPSNARLTVVVGVHNKCDKTGPDYSEGGQEFLASEVFMHEDFVYPEKDNDIAILKLPQDIIFNARVWPACLPDSATTDYTGKSVTVSGWGTNERYRWHNINPAWATQCKLQETTLKVTADSDSRCNLRSNHPIIFYISKNTTIKGTTPSIAAPDSSRLCAYSRRTGTCQGDSGGPLTLRQGKRYVLLGITSYGRGCADSRYAGVFARVQGFLPWIKEKVPAIVGDTWTCGTAPTSAPDNGVPGKLHSPGFPGNYPNNQDKTFPISVAEGKVIQVTFNIVDIEYHKTCSYDYVMATEGDGKVLMKRTCGSEKAPPAFTSETNKVQIIFHSDVHTNSKGFQLSWKAVDQDPRESSGSLTSPDYPRNYPNKIEETYPIQVDQGKRIKVTFTDFNLEFDNSCRWDYLKVTDDDGSVLMDKTCGDDKPADLTSNTERVWVLFHTDATVPQKGFKIIWTAV